MDVMQLRRGLLKQNANKNLFTRVGEHVDYYVDASGMHPSSGWIASDYIDVLPNKMYQFEPNSTKGARAKHLIYDENKAYISNIDSGPITFTTPPNARYMVFSYRSTSYDITLKYV